MTAADTPPQTPTARRKDATLFGVGPDDRLIRLSEVEHLVGYGPTSIYAKIKVGVFPKPVKAGTADSSRWVLGEVRQFVATAIAARDRRERTAPPERRSATLPA
jgi:prophage regulatory protein